MNILLIGSGGREHALAWKMSQSRQCTELFIAPGNAGTATCGTNVPLDILNFEQIFSFIKDRQVGMLVVGPEVPLVEGIYDYMKAADPSLIVVGPSREAAQLEGSKAFAKTFMEAYGIPTARYREFTAKTVLEGLDYIRQQHLPVVLKADGLAAGKGVLICENYAEAQREFESMLQGKFGQASNKVVIEEFLKGIEFSVFVITDGEHYRLLPVAKDYKRVGAGDTGLNTGGMGAVSPVSFVDAALMQKVEQRIIRPTIQGIAERGYSYKGFIFFGLINVNGDPYVIEYNCRMGDPETQVVIPRLENDLVDLFVKMEKGQLGEVKIEEKTQAAAAVILVSGGYPGKYEKGKTIEGADAIRNSLVFHAGTKLEGHQLKTNGGRVLAVTSLDENVDTAIRLSNQNAEKIKFAGKYFRQDIGFDI